MLNLPKVTADLLVPDNEILNFPAWLEAFSTRAAHASSLTATMLEATYMMNLNVLAQLQEALAKSDTLSEDVSPTTDLCLQQLNSAVMEAQLMSHDATLVASELYANLHLCRRRQVLNSPQIKLSRRDKDRLLLLPIGGKAALLVSLVSAARGSELVALARADHNRTFSSDPSGARHVSIWLFPKFMPKNALPNTIPASIRYTGIAHLFPREPERLFCPVNVLGLHIIRTQPLADQAGTDRLILHFQHDSQVLTSHFRLWVAEAIQRAYQMVPDKGPQQINAREVRAIASSISYYK